jgi:hypothetical protein
MKRIGAGLAILNVAAKSAYGPQRRFAAMQQGARNRRISGLSADAAGTPALMLSIE